MKKLFKLKNLNIEYESIEGAENIINLGFSSSPVIECEDGTYYVGGAECMKFVNSLN